MQQPSASIELPQFSNLVDVALNLTRAYTSWHDAKSGQDIFSYFDSVPRHTGDEHGLRASLIREYILPIFHYAPSQIEYESRERYDLTLWSQNTQDRRRIAIIETKSSSVRNLTVTQKGRETPTEQLERYLTQAGLYLGVLTNGDEWHLFDFAVGNEPLASFSLIELARLLQDAPTKEAVEQRLSSQPLLQQALAINFYYLDASRWEQTNVFRQNLANNAYHRIASLQKPENVELLVQQIKQVLGSLRETIHAQFSLLQQRYDEYQQQCTFTNSKDNHPFEEPLKAAIENVVQFGIAFRLDDNGQLRSGISKLLAELTEDYFLNGDISAFEEAYLQRAKELLKPYQLSQVSLQGMGRRINHSIRSLPPTEGLDALKNLLRIHYTYLKSLADEYALSKKTLEAYSAWQSRVRGVFGNPQDEFCLQTAYISFVRLFFVRVCEDHNLIPRRISDGPFARYEEYRVELLSGIKDTYLRLLEETYQRARVVYHNFFGRQELFDWFTLDEYTILALFDLLNRYDFQGLSADVLGRVYNEGYIETKERSEKGQFYTPPQVVDYMLDSLGIPGHDEPDELKSRSFLEKTVGDLSCGSGTFLVAAASRKSAILQRLVKASEINHEYAIEVLTDTFLGFDLNPFACYLAEINLLIQCLPLLLDERGQLCRSVDRFHIYCTDALEPTVAEQVEALRSGKATERLSFRTPRTQVQAISDEERHIVRIKEAKGLPSELTEFNVGIQGIDYLLGNPPYVSAGESSVNLLYRNAIQDFGIYQLLHQRWDLFVPFFERNLQFLRPETGRLGLIVSKGIETEGYAERLRQLLSSQYRLLEIDFFPALRLFQDAAIENTIVLVENRAPDEEHEVIRRKHLQADCSNYEALPPIPQSASNGQIFRWRYDSLLDKSLAQGSIPLCAIVYIGTGIEAQSKESFDPIIAGKRQKIFTLDDVFLSPTRGSKRPSEYTDEGVLGDDVDRYYLRRNGLASVAELFDLRYLLGIINSRFIRQYVASNRLEGTREGRVYPDVWKRLPIKVASAERQQQIALLVDAIQAQYEQLAAIPTPTLLAANSTITFRDPQGYLALGVLRFFGDVQSTIAERPTLQSGRLLLRRQPLAYLESSEPELLRYLELYFTQINPKLQSWTWIEARKRIQIPATLEAVRAFIASVDHAAEEERRIRKSIDSLSAEIEALIETTYKESADANLMSIIGTKMAHGNNMSLF